MSKKAPATPTKTVAIRVTIAGVTYETTLAGELVAMREGK
jgi:hypothetical protein